MFVIYPVHMYIVQQQRALLGKYSFATEYTIYIALYNTSVLSIEQWTNMLACAAVHFLKLKRGTNQSLADAFGQKQTENPIVVFFITRSSTVNPN